MTDHRHFPAHEPGKSIDACQLSPRKEDLLPALLGEVYAQAPPTERRSIIQTLMAPLGILSLAAIANGIFVKLRFKGDWSAVRNHMPEVQNIQISDVIALAERAQQVSLQSLDGLAQVLTSSPSLASSAAAAILITILTERARCRRIDDN